MSVAYDPFAPEFRDDPFPVYRQLRDQAPVHWAPDAGCYCVSRYDDVVAVLKDTESFSSRAMFTVLMNGGLALLPSVESRAVAYQLLDRAVERYEERMGTVSPNWGREFIDVRTGAYPRLSGPSR